MTKEKYIYRCENALGKGVYKGTTLQQKAFEQIFGEDFYEQEEWRPIPVRDNKIKRHSNIGEICGFKDLRQAFKWFTKKELKMLKRLGFPLKKIKVSKITAVGETQVLAIR